MLLTAQAAGQVRVLAQEASPSPTPSAPGSFLDVSTSRGFALLLTLIGILVLAWFIPFMTDLILSYRRLPSNAEKDSPPERGAEGPAGTPGLVRALIALTIITIVGIALLLVLSGNTTDAIDLRKTLITGIVAIVGTVAGFYFGGRTAESAAKAERDAAANKVSGTLTLTPDEAEFTRNKPDVDFTLSNNSTESITVVAVTVTDDGSGFEVVTQDLPAGWWSGEAEILAPSSQMLVHVRWTPPPGAGPFDSTLTVAHSASGVPSARLTGTP